MARTSETAELLRLLTYLLARKVAVTRKPRDVPHFQFQVTAADVDQPPGHHHPCSDQPCPGVRQVDLRHCEGVAARCQRPMRRQGPYVRAT